MVPVVGGTGGKPADTGELRGGGGTVHDPMINDKWIRTMSILMDSDGSTFGGGTSISNSGPQRPAVVAGGGSPGGHPIRAAHGAHPFAVDRALAPIWGSPGDVTDAYDQLAAEAGSWPGRLGDTGGVGPHAGRGGSPSHGQASPSRQRPRVMTSVRDAVTCRVSLEAHGWRLCAEHCARRRTRSSTTATPGAYGVAPGIGRLYRARPGLPVDRIGSSCATDGCKVSR